MVLKHAQLFIVSLESKSTDNTHAFQLDEQTMTEAVCKRLMLPSASDLLVEELQNPDYGQTEWADTAASSLSCLKLSWQRRRQVV